MKFFDLLGEDVERSGPGGGVARAARRPHLCEPRVQAVPHPEQHALQDRAQGGHQAVGAVQRVAHHLELGRPGARARGDPSRRLRAEGGRRIRHSVRHFVRPLQTRGHRAVQERAGAVEPLGHERGAGRRARRRHEHQPGRHPLQPALLESLRPLQARQDRRRARLRRVQLVLQRPPLLSSRLS